jgi:signal transduction histidine kinase
VRNTLTWRVTWAITATVALFVGLMAAVAFSVMYEQEDELADQLGQIEMRRLIERFEHGEIDIRRQPIEIGPRTQAWIGNGESDPGMPVALRGLSAGPHELDLDDRVVHAVVADTGIGHLTVIFDATQNEKRVREFGLVLAILWSICLAGGYWLARATAGIVVGRMHAITERIAGWDPDTAQIEQAGPSSGDEAGRLLEAFNRMQDRVDRSIAREREFAANLSHEIRTPLTALRSDIEMATLDVDASADQRQRLSRMALAVDEINATIRAARAMSRPQSASSRQPFDLGALIEEVCRTLGVRAATAGLEIFNEVPEGQNLLADRYALVIVVRNLIGNAIDHAAPATLRIRLSDGRLQFADNGPGINEDELPFVFERYHHGRLVDQPNQGFVGIGDHGLGLSIARRVCEQQGWLISVTSQTLGEWRGTRFDLAFDENST